MRHTINSTLLFIIYIFFSTKMVDKKLFEIKPQGEFDAIININKTRTYSIKIVYLGYFYSPKKIKI